MDSANVHTVCLHKETFCNNGTYEALFGHLSPKNFVVYGKKYKVWVLLVFLVRMTGILRKQVIPKILFFFFFS